MRDFICLTFSVAVLAGCANPLNAITADRYSHTCTEGEQAGNLPLAEEACRRALINARIGNLGPSAESQTLYNLGRIKRQMGKFAEAEEIYRESLRINDSLPNPDPVKTARRLAELSIVIGLQGRMADTWPVLGRLIPMAGQLSGTERSTVKGLFEGFAQEFTKLGMAAEADQLRNKASSL